MTTPPRPEAPGITFRCRNATECRCEKIPWVLHWCHRVGGTFDAYQFVDAIVDLPGGLAVYWRRMPCPKHRELIEGAASWAGFGAVEHRLAKRRARG